MSVEEKNINIQEYIDAGKFEFANSEKPNEVLNDYSEQSFLKNAVRLFMKNKGAVIGLICLFIIIIFSIIGPSFNEYTYDIGDITQQNLPPRIPGLEKLGIFDGTLNGVNVYEEKGFLDVYYFFGSDVLGRDLWTRVFVGTRISLLVAVVAVGVDMIIGVVYGLLSGYFGGVVDMAMQRVIEVINGIPTLVIVTLLMIILKPGLGTIILALLVAGWIGMSRLVRAQVLQHKEQEYVLAARTLGAPNRKIIFKEILPNTVGQIVIMSMMSVPAAIFMESFLSYIGLGIPAPNASLGVLISEGYKSMRIYPFTLWIPVIIFAVLMISLNLIADGLRDALDPKMKGR